MVLNTTLNKPEYRRENHRPTGRHWQTLSHNTILLYRVHLAMSGIRTRNEYTNRYQLQKKTNLALISWHCIKDTITHGPIPMFD